MIIVVLMVMMLKHQSACDLCGLCHQFGAVPNGLELLRYWKLPLSNNQKTSGVKQELQHWIKTNPDARRESCEHSPPLVSKHSQNHHPLAVPGCSSQSSWHWRCHSWGSPCSGRPGSPLSCWWRWWELFPIPKERPLAITNRHARHNLHSPSPNQKHIFSLFTEFGGIWCRETQHLPLKQCKDLFL